MVQPGPRGSRRSARSAAPRVRRSAGCLIRRARPQRRSGSSAVPKDRKASRACKVRKACRDRRARKVRKVRPVPRARTAQDRSRAPGASRSPSAPALVATAVAKLRVARRDLLVTGGCYADPQWMAQLVASRPVAMTDNSNPRHGAATTRTRRRPRRSRSSPRRTASPARVVRFGRRSRRLSPAKIRLLPDRQRRGRGSVPLSYTRTPSAFILLSMATTSPSGHAARSPIRSVAVTTAFRERAGRHVDLAQARPETVRSSD